MLQDIKSAANPQEEEEEVVQCEDHVITGRLNVQSEYKLVNKFNTTYTINNKMHSVCFALQINIKHHNVCDMTYTFVFHA